MARIYSLFWEWEFRLQIEKGIISYQLGWISGQLKVVLQAVDFWVEIFDPSWLVPIRNWFLKSKADIITRVKLCQQPTPVAFADACLITVEANYLWFVYRPWFTTGPCKRITTVFRNALVVWLALPWMASNAPFAFSSFKTITLKSLLWQMSHTTASRISSMCPSKHFPERCFE